MQSVTDTSSLPATISSLLYIPQPPHQAPLSAQQQSFNDWVQRIAQQRAWLQAWDQAASACRMRFARDGIPLRTRYLDGQAALANYLDQQSQRKLSRQERQVLEQCLLESAQQVADWTELPAQRAAMQELLQRYSTAEGDDLPQTTESSALTETTSPDIDWEDPEAVAAFVEAQSSAAAAQAERARAQHQAQRQQRKAQQAQKAKAPTAAELATQSLREVYRRLASKLHPDREPDPQEQARKTALMQRVNRAYEAGQLMELLELQWEAEYIDTAKLALLSDERLAPYNRMLQSQYSDLQREAQARTQVFAQEFGLSTSLHLRPAKLMAQVRERLQQLQSSVDYLQHLLLTFEQDPQSLKLWLKQQRKLSQSLDDE